MRPKPTSWFAGLGLILSFAMGGTARCDDVEPLRPSDRDRLLVYARDTWKSLTVMADGTELPADGLRHLQNGQWRPSPKTTPTDIGAYLWSTIAAERLGIIRPEQSLRRLRRSLESIERLERHKGFFFDTIDPKSGRTLRASPYHGRKMDPILSSVDNGWMATGLIVVRNTCPELRDRADALLKPMDFGFFFKPFRPGESRNWPGLIHGPYWPDHESFGGFQRVLNTEQRIVTYIGIARGQLPRTHYYHPARTLEPTERQYQKPEGVWRTYLGVQVFEGHYKYRGMRIVPSWGGSMFEALMVPLFVPEEQWAPKSWGVNHPLYVRGQIAHGLEEARYGYWGFSPAANPEGGYRTYGVGALGTDPKGYTSSNDDVPSRGEGPPTPSVFRNGVVTPHASFLALRFAPRQAMDNLEKLRSDFPIYGEYGFMDSVNVGKGVVSDMVLALDQGMIMAAIANALTADGMRHAFSDSGFERAIRPLIEPEEFTAGDDRPAGVARDGR